MNNEEFNSIVEECIEDIKKTLVKKSEEYAMDGDRLYNFKVAAAMTGETPEKALYGIMAKHLVSVRDLAYGKLKPTLPMLKEKIGDNINYLILLKAILMEKKED